MKITYAIEETPLGTAGAIKNVEQHITGPFFVLNGDIFTSLDLRAMREYHHEKGGFGVLASHPRRGSVAVRLRRARRDRPHHRLRREAAERRRADQRNQRGHVSARARDSRFHSGRSRRFDRARNVSASRSPTGKALYALHDRRLLDRSRPARAISRRASRRAQRRDAAGRRAGNQRRGQARHCAGTPASCRRSTPAPTSSSTPARQSAPTSCSGAAAASAPGAVVRESVLWERVSVGAGAIIEEAIVASGVTIGPKARVARGSVIGHDVTIEPGAVLEPGARVGSPPERIPG